MMKTMTSSSLRRTQCPENAESEEEENPERRDESTQDIIHELEALPDEIFDAFPDELSSFCLEMETEMDRRRALHRNDTLRRTRQTTGS